jgi:hypothetical protein
MLTSSFSISFVSFVLLQQLELLYKTGQAVDHGPFPQPFSLNWYQCWCLASLVGRNHRHYPNQTTPDHFDSTGSELLQE